MSNLLNRVKVSTATLGTGTIALGAADPRFQTFAAAGAVNGATYSYVIEEGLDWAINEGVYNSVAQTLTRTLIASSTGAMLSLQGTARVTVVPNVRSMQPHVGPSRTPLSWLHPMGVGDGGGTNTPTANIIVTLPFVMRQGRMITQISLTTGVTVVAASTCKVGIYACPGNKGLPVGSPILTTLDISTAVANSEMIATGLNFFLPAGLYWMAVFTSAATNFIRLGPNGGRDAILSQIPYTTFPGPNGYGALLPRINATYPNWPTLTGLAADFATFNDDQNSMPYVGLGVTS